MADKDVLFNLTNCSDHSVIYTTPGCSSSGVVVAEIFILSAIFIGSLLGNGLILLVIQRSRRSEWTTNYFVLSLGLTNLTIPFMCVIWTMAWVMRGSWLFGDISCKITFFFQFLNASVSAGFLACISLDRFYIIVHPLKFKMSRSQTKELISFVWIFMICSAAPTLYFFETKTTTRLSSVNFCLSAFDTVQWKVFIMSFFLIAFCVPLLFTLVMYLRITYAVITRNQHAKHHSTSFRRQALRVPRSKVKVLRMLFLQWFVFVCCCFPYFFSFLLQALKTISMTHETQISLLLLSFSNAALNVAIYALFSGDFRQGCKRVFCKPDASQAYRLTSLGRKNRIAPFEFSSGEHGEGIDFRLIAESKTLEKHLSSNRTHQSVNGCFNNLEKQTQAWVVRRSSERQASV